MESPFYKLASIRLYKSAEIIPRELSGTMNNTIVKDPIVLLNAVVLIRRISRINPYRSFLINL